MSNRKNWTTQGVHLSELAFSSYEDLVDDGLSFLLINGALGSVDDAQWLTITNCESLGMFRISMTQNGNKRTLYVFVHEYQGYYSPYIMLPHIARFDIHFGQMPESIYTPDVHKPGENVFAALDVVAAYDPQRVIDVGQDSEYNGALVYKGPRRNVAIITWKDDNGRPTFEKYVGYETSSTSIQPMRRTSLGEGT